MNKLEMAHQYFMQTIGFIKNNDIDHTIDDVVSESWDYADAMQAEADKRKIGDAKDELTGSRALQQNFMDSIEQPRYSDEQWQPDWSQAPEWANWWAMDKNKQGIWHNKMPCNKQSVAGWIIDFSAGSDFSYKLSPNFNYQGNWKDSIRKRP